MNQKLKLPALLSLPLPSLVIALLIWQPLDFFTNLAVALAAGYLSVSLFCWHAAVSRRVALSNDKVWHVLVEGTHVGDIEDHKVAAIEQEVYTSPRMIMAQLSNCLDVAGSILMRAAKIIPLTLFWLVVLNMVLHPQGFFAALQLLPDAISQSSPAHLLGLASIGLLWGGGVVAILLLTGWREYGFRNCFRPAVNARIRNAMNTQLQGRLFLFEVLPTQ